MELLRGGKQGIEEWNRRGDQPPPDLTGVDLSGANLFLVNLTGTNLTGAKLRAANLTMTNLRLAHLREADLDGAMLAGTILHGTDLGGTKFSGASLLRAVLGDLDLSKADGLDSVTHLGPSNLGTDTLYRSGGDIPDVFLRGSGLPDSLIKRIPGLIRAAGPVLYYSVFISYSREDESFANRLFKDLQDQGIRCWLDVHELKPGDDIYAEVDKGVSLFDKVLLCCSTASLESWWVWREIDTAFEKERKLHDESGKYVLVIIPLDLDGYLFKWKGEPPRLFRRLFYVSPTPVVGTSLRS